MLCENFNSLESKFKKIINKDLIGLVFCAADSHTRKDFRELNLRELEKIFRINLIGAYEITRIAAKFMCQKFNGKGGSIVYLTSQVAQFGGNQISAYAASKGGLNALAISLARELGPEKIRVNAISPGPVDTSEGKEEILNSKLTNIPLGRLCTPKDVANLVNFLISPDASFLSGSIIPLHGAR